MVRERSLEAELYRCKKHLRALLEAQEIYKKEVEQKARELERAKEMLEIAFNSLEMGILVVDRESNVVIANKALRELFKTDENFEGKKCWEFLYKRESPCSDRKCLKVFESGEKLEEEMVFLKNGRKRIYMVRTYPWRHSGEVLGLIRTFIDITDRKLAEEYEILSGISTYMAHIIKNSITPVGGFINRLKKSGSIGPEEIDFMLNSISKLERSVFEYESYVRIKSRHLFELFNVTSLLEGVSKSFKDETFLKKFFLLKLKDRIELEFDLYDKEVMLLGNKYVFETGINHLIACMVSYGCEMGMDSVKARFASMLEENSFVCTFSVNFALSEKMQRLALEPWKSEGGEEFDRWGVAICAQAVSFHDGSFSISSDERNTNFKISIPLPAQLE